MWSGQIDDPSPFSLQQPKWATPSFGSTLKGNKVKQTTDKLDSRSIILNQAAPKRVPCAKTENGFAKKRN